MPEVSLPTARGVQGPQVAPVDPHARTQAYVGGKIGLFQVFSAAGPLSSLPAHAVVTSNRQRDVVVLQTRLDQLKQEEKDAGLQFGLAITAGQVIKYFKGPVFRSKEGDPIVEKSASLQEALDKANRFEPVQRTRSIEVNKEAALATALAGAADLGAIGSGTKYLKANSALDAQQQELDRLNAMVASGDAITIAQEEALEAQQNAAAAAADKQLESPVVAEAENIVGKLKVGPADPVFVLNAH